MILDLLAYAASASVLVAYWFMARGGSVVPFHWANALGSIPIFAVGLRTGAYPTLVLTGAFGVLGWVGLWKEKHGKKEELLAAQELAGPEPRNQPALWDLEFG